MNNTEPQLLVALSPVIIAVASGLFARSWKDTLAWATVACLATKFALVEFGFAVASLDARWSSWVGELLGQLIFVVALAEFAHWTKSRDRVALAMWCAIALILAGFVAVVMVGASSSTIIWLIAPVSFGALVGLGVNASYRTKQKSSAGSGWHRPHRWLFLGAASTPSEKQIPTPSLEAPPPTPRVERRSATPIVDRWRLRFWPILVAAIAAPILCWPFTPSLRDRWIKAEGSVACFDEAEIDEIADYTSVGARRAAISEYAVDKKCDSLLLNERVRIIKFGSDGNKSLVVLYRDGREMWVELSALKADSPTWLVMPWYGKANDPSRVADQNSPRADQEAVAAFSWPSTYSSRDIINNYHPEVAITADVRTSNIAPSNAIREELNPYDKYVTPDSFPSFEHVSLDHGISLDAPVGWAVLSAETRAAFRQAGTAISKVAGAEDIGGRKALFATYSDLTNPAARIEIGISPLLLTEKQIAGMSDLALKRAGDQLRDGYKRSEKAGGPKIIQMKSVQAVQLNKRMALLIEYVRASNDGEASPWIVKIYHVATPERMIEITLSHRESEEATWTPILNRVKESIRF